MKSIILDLLKKSSDNHISGEELSKSLGVTRAAIWKYIKALKEEGYEINSVSNKGYKLISSPDLLTYEEISPHLRTNIIGRNIYYFQSIDSTNIKAKELARQGEKEGTLIISESQSSGKGRLGRAWTSPKDKGIWMSLILRPDVEPSYASKITLIAAAAVHKAIKEYCNINCGIKWPNDIVINNKKVCGILTEMSGELNKINYIILGIGINANLDLEDFPEEIRSIASSIKLEKGDPIIRKNLIAKIMNEFEILYNEMINYSNINSTIEICRTNSIFIGKEVKLINKNEVIIAKVIDIDDQGELIIEKEDGTILPIISGEVSMRGLYGYI